MGPLSGKQQREWAKHAAKEQRESAKMEAEEARKQQLHEIKLQEAAAKANQGIGHKEELHGLKVKELGGPLGGKPKRINREKLGLPSLNPLAGTEVFHQGQHMLSKGTDTVPAMLTPGEAVIPRAAAQNPKNKPLIKQMVQEGRMANRAKGYADGTEEIPNIAGNMYHTDSVATMSNGTTGVRYYEDGVSRVTLEGMYPSSNQGIAPYGLREMESATDTVVPKGRGYVGEIPSPDGTITEYSASDKNGQYPLVVPTLGREDITNIQNGNVTPEIDAKARSWRDSQELKGESPFYSQGIKAPLGAGDLLYKEGQPSPVHIQDLNPNSGWTGELPAGSEYVSPVVSNGTQVATTEKVVPIKVDNVPEKVVAKSNKPGLATTSAYKRLDKDGNLVDVDPVKDVINKSFKIEGGFVKDDAGKGPTNLGINWQANEADLTKLGYTRETMNKLTKEDAAKIYENKYIRGPGFDKLYETNPPLANAVIDASINMGQPTAKRLLEMSGGDLTKFNELRKQEYRDIVKRDPEKGVYLKQWLDRADVSAGFKDKNTVEKAEQSRLAEAQKSFKKDPNAIPELPTNLEPEANAALMGELGRTTKEIVEQGELDSRIDGLMTKYNSTPEVLKSKLSNLFEEVYGPKGIFDKRELVRFGLLAAASRAMGYNTAHSVRYAGREALKAADTRHAQEAAAQIKRDDRIFQLKVEGIKNIRELNENRRAKLGDVLGNKDIPQNIRDQVHSKLSEVDTIEDPYKRAQVLQQVIDYTNKFAVPSGKDADTKRGGFFYYNGEKHRGYTDKDQTITLIDRSGKPFKPASEPVAEEIQDAFDKDIARTVEHNITPYLQTKLRALHGKNYSEAMTTAEAKRAGEAAIQTFRSMGLMSSKDAAQVASTAMQWVKDSNKDVVNLPGAIEGSALYTLNRTNQELFKTAKGEMPPIENIIDLNKKLDAEVTRSNSGLSQYDKVQAKQERLNELAKQWKSKDLVHVRTFYENSYGKKESPFLKWIIENHKTKL